MHSSVEELTTIDEIGQVIAESVVAYFGDARNVEIVQRLRDAGLQMEVSADVEIGKTDKLSGKTIVISGVFEHYSRDEYKSLIERNGGKMPVQYPVKRISCLPERIWGRRNLKRRKRWASLF